MFCVSFEPNVSLMLAQRRKASGCHRKKILAMGNPPPPQKNSKQMSMNMTTARFFPKQILNTSYTL